MSDFLSSRERLEHRVQTLRLARWALTAGPSLATPAATLSARADEVEAAGRPDEAATVRHAATWAERFGLAWDDLRGEP